MPQIVYYHDTWESLLQSNNELSIIRQLALIAFVILEYKYKYIYIYIYIYLYKYIYIYIYIFIYKYISQHLLCNQTKNYFVVSFWHLIY